MVRRAVVRMSLVLVLMLSCAVLAACSAIPRVSTADAKRVGVKARQLKRGRALYLDRCSECHAVHRPARFTSEDWQVHMARMTPIARVNDVHGDRNLICACPPIISPGSPLVSVRMCRFSATTRRLSAPGEGKLSSR